MTDRAINSSVFRSLSDRVPNSVLGALPDEEDLSAEESRFLDPDAVASFVKLERCPQHFKYKTQVTPPRSNRESRDEYSDLHREGFTQVRPIHIRSGNEYESAVVEYFANHHPDSIDVVTAETMAADIGVDDVDVNRGLDYFFQRILDVHGNPDTDPVMFDQLPIGGVLEAWPVSGRADIVFLFGTEDGVTIHVIDVKSAREEKPQHRIQVGLYTSLLREWLVRYGPRHGVEAQIGGGIIHRQTDLEDIGTITPENIPSFDLRPIEFDVRELLAVDGRLVEIAETPQRNVDYRVNQKCQQCLYNEECHGHSVEDERLSLLGISRSAQAQLRNIGVRSVSDLAALGEPPADQFDDGPLPHEYDGFDLNTDAMDRIRDVADVGHVGADLYPIVQKAQAALGKIDPESDVSFRSDRTFWRPGSGPCSVPDERSLDTEDPMVRVYLHVERDHPYDRVAMVSAYITTTAHDGGVSISSLIDDPLSETWEHASKYHKVQQQEEEYAGLERDLLDRFLNGEERHDGLFDAISSMVDGPSPIHFYVYSSPELDAFQQMLEDHDTEVDRARSLRDMLGLRDAMGRPIDQPMVSVVRDEVVEHINLPTPNDGLIPVWGELYPEDRRFDDEVGIDDLVYTDPDGEEIDLRETFHFRLFNDSEAIERTENGVRFLYGARADVADDYYPVRFREGAQIPLEYVWGVVGRELPSYDDGQKEYRRRRYLYRTNNPSNPDGDETPADVYDRIRKTDVLALGEKMANMVAHVEGALRFRDWSVEKPPLDVENVGGFGFGEPATDASARDYLYAEFNAQRDDHLSHYALRAWQRPMTGRSAIVEVEDIEHADSNYPPFRVTCRMPYDDLDALYSDSPEEMARKCRFKQRVDSGRGSYAVANRIDSNTVAPAPPNPMWDDDGRSLDDPEQIERGPQVEIVDIDANANPPRLVFEAKPTFYGSDDDDRLADDFQIGRYSWYRPDPGEAVDNAYSVPITEGDWFVLDQAASGVQGSVTVDMLDGRNNEFFHLLEGVQDGTDVGSFRDGLAGEMQAFADSLADNIDPDGFPNARQRAFIEESDERVVMLQGPPGTGKTAGALAPALLARASAAVSTGEDFVAVVTAPSNKALDEAFEDTAALATALDAADGVDTAALSRIPIVRASGSVPESDEVPVGGSYINYNDGAGVNAPDTVHNVSPHNLYQRVLSNVRNAEGRTGGESVSLGSNGTIIFATTFGLRRFLDDVPREAGDDAVDALHRGQRFFDLLAIDEASMMSLPSAAVGGGFLRDDGQLMLVGDHRQMPPVNQYPWSDERRRPITSTAPHLSVLDRFRLADAEESRRMEAHGEDKRLGIDFDDLAFDGDGDIGFVRLDTSYRCRPHVSGFLSDGIYAADGIDFRSGGPAIGREIEDVEPESEPLGETLDPDSDPQVVLVELDQNRGQQSNPAEAAVVSAVASSIGDEHDVGVVVPHNAQRSLIGAYTDADADIETVERFQGGERDVIAVSATVADPDYLSGNSDFVLDPRRLNVAMSRMQRTLIVVVSSSLFRTVPRDLDVYERASLWKRFRSFVSGDGAEWSGTVGELAGDMDVPRADVHADVYVR